MNKFKDHAPLIAQLIDTHNIHVFAEIGVWKFKLGKKILINPSVNRTLKEYWAIDPYQEMPQYKDRTPDQVMSKMGQIKQTQWNTTYQIACKYLLWFHQVKLLRLTSKQAAKLFKPAYFDMVFIDADHTEEAVTEDFNLWKPRVRPGGILCGHDYHSYIEVQQAIDKQPYDIQLFPDECMWLMYV